MCWVIWVTLPGAGVATWQARTAGQLATAVTDQLLEVFWASEDGGVAVVLADHLCVWTRDHMATRLSVTGRFGEHC